MSSSSPLVRAVFSTVLPQYLHLLSLDIISCMGVLQSKHNYSDNDIACALSGSHISLYFTLKIGLTTKMSVNINEYLSII